MRHRLPTQTPFLLPDRYKDHLAPGMRLLDLMASWQSHLPDGVSFRHVTGLGMNAAELLANSSLTDFSVQVQGDRGAVLPSLRSVASDVIK